MFLPLLIIFCRCLILWACSGLVASRSSSDTLFLALRCLWGVGLEFCRLLEGISSLEMDPCRLLLTARDGLESVEERAASRYDMLLSDGVIWRILDRGGVRAAFKPGTIFKSFCFSNKLVRCV